MRHEHTALAMIVATISVTTCGGKVVVDEGGTAGQGGTSSSSSSTPVSATTGSFATTGNGVGGSTGPGSDVTSGDTGGGPAACVHCGEAIAGVGDPGQLCPDSQSLFDALFSCACKVSCPYQCGDNVCQQGTASQGCVECIQQSCGAELMGCANDA